MAQQLEDFVATEVEKTRIVFTATQSELLALLLEKAFLAGMTLGIRETTASIREVLRKES